MLFTPFAGEHVCRRLPTKALEKGTPNMEPRYDLERASWLWHPDLKEREPGFVLFRLEFESAAAERVQLQVSGDLVFALALDGALIARGPDTGAPDHWCFATYELALNAGAHRLEALVWWAQPPAAPAGRMTWRGGFVCASPGSPEARFDTGAAPWRVTRLDGVSWGPGIEGFYHVIGGAAKVNLATFDAATAEWKEPSVVRGPIRFHECGIVAPGWKLRPSALPEQRHDFWRGGKVRALSKAWSEGAKVRIEPAAVDTPADDWNALWREGRALTLPASYAATLLLDADDYLCGFPQIEISGGKGATLNWQWAEALYETENTTGPKGDRREISGKVFYGFGDTWEIPGGARRWIGAPWWRSGRFVLLRVRVGAEPLTVHAIGVERTGFPLATRARWVSSDATLPPIVEIGERGLRSCMHDVFVDCPHYEQMMYVADTRLQMLLAYVTSGDDRLARRGMELFDLSRDIRGFPAMRHPSLERQESATFAMIWPWMLHDFALWRDDFNWLRSRLPGMRALLEGLRASEEESGMLRHAPGWLFADWVPAWPAGWAPGTREGRLSSLVNFQYLLTLQCAADLETWAGEPALAERHRARLKQVERGLIRFFWNDERGLWADDDEHRSFSQHAQALAVLGGLRVPAVERWADAAANDLAPATIYFQHYLFDALGKLGRGDLILQRLDTWRELVRQDLKTTIENAEIGRSDCHAWGAHPIFHLHATLAGVRPTAPGFRRVRIAPSPGPLEKIEVELPHPRGLIRMHAQFSAGKAKAIVELPPLTSGEFVWGGRSVELRTGRQEVSV